MDDEVVFVGKDPSDGAHIKVLIDGLREALAAQGYRLVPMTAQQDERVAFIRQAAALLYAKPCMGVDSARAWALAKKLWDRKPEDC